MRPTAFWIRKEEEKKVEKAGEEGVYIVWGLGRIGLEIMGRFLQQG